MAKATDGYCSSETGHRLGQIGTAQFWLPVDSEEARGTIEAALSRLYRLSEETNVPIEDLSDTTRFGEELELAQEDDAERCFWLGVLRGASGLHDLEVHDAIATLEAQRRPAPTKRNAAPWPSDTAPEPAPSGTLQQVPTAPAASRTRARRR